MDTPHTPFPAPRPLTPDKVRQVRAHIRQRGVDPMRLLDPVEALIVLIL